MMFFVIVVFLFLIFLGPIIDYFVYEFDFSRLINIRLGYLYHRKYKLLNIVLSLKEKVKISFKNKQFDKLERKVDKILKEYEKVCSQIKKLKIIKKTR